MPRRKNSAKKLEWKEVLAGQEDFLRPLIREVIQEVMEAEMDEAVGAERASERRIAKATVPVITAARW
jgi:transposase-like protein